MARVVNWGNYPAVDGEIRGFSGDADLARAMADWPDAIARGLGRSYGDASLGPRMLDARRRRRFLAFDEGAGELTCEAGASLAEILETFTPRGWFPPVVPGTKFVTVGGAVAADIHGKNHHKDGSFGGHVRALRLATAAGETRCCGPDQDDGLFWATCGGMGLTGVILETTLRLKPVQSAYIVQDVERARDLDEIMDRFAAAQDAAYSVAWIDCLARGARQGRSVMITGEHATLDQLDEGRRRRPFHPKLRRDLSAPFHLPGFTLNRWTVKAFNACYYGLAPRRKKRTVVDYDRFFFPLDSVHHWNRIYGRRGFIQYQCALPLAESRRGLAALLSAIAAAGEGSFLAVLKLFGKPGPGPLSFPIEGYTLALDFPVKPSVMKLLDALDRITLDHGGRLYLAKDARMPAEVFTAGYDRLAEFAEVKAAVDAGGRWSSRQSKRLGLS